MRLKVVKLIYQGRGVFTTRRKLAFRKGQRISAYLGPTPVTDATRGILKLSSRLAKRLAHDPALSPWNS